MTDPPRPDFNIHSKLLSRPGNISGGFNKTAEEEEERMKSVKKGGSRQSKCWEVGKVQEEEVGGEEIKI